MNPALPLVCVLALSLLVVTGCGGTKTVTKTVTVSDTAKSGAGSPRQVVEFGYVKSLKPNGAGASFVAYGANSLWVSEEEVAVFRVSLATRAVTTRLPEAAAHELAFGNGAAWVALAGPGQILRIDADDATRKRIPVGSLPTGVAVGFGAVWVASANNDAVWRVNAVIGDVEDVVHVGDRPAGVAVAAGSVWVANHHAGTVSRIDPRTNEVVATVRTG
jgi:virginiamycin B lyase